MKALHKTRWYEIHILKILSLIVSTFLWFYVVNSEPIQMQKDFTITVKSPVGYAVESIKPHKVNVTLKGARAFLKRYKNEKALAVTIDLSRAKLLNGAKVINYELTKSDFNLPFGVDLEDLETERISIKFDKYIKKRVPIKLDLVGDVPTGLKLIAAKISPSNVMIEGPRNLMKKVGQVKTKAIDTVNLSGKGEMAIQLLAPPKFIRYENEPQLKFIFNVVPKKANLTLKRVNIKFISSTQRFKPSARKVSLDVLAPEGRSIRASEVNVFANIPTKKKGRVKVRLSAELPDGVYLLKVNPEFINVRIY